LSLFGHNFCSWAPIEKIYIFPRSLLVFISSKKVSKIYNKNSARKYLAKIPFFSRTDNGRPLEVNTHSSFYKFGSIIRIIGLIVGLQPQLSNNKRCSKKNAKEIKIKT